MTYKTLERYIWLIDVLTTQSLTLEQVSEEWEKSALKKNFPNELSRRTFHLHKAAISKIFGIEIECNKKSTEYYYSIDNNTANKTVLNHQQKQWIINSFTLSNMIREGANMKNRILFEKIPGGGEYLPTAVDAMKRDAVLEVEYEPFGKDCITLHMEPYCLKVYKQRWYIIGRIQERDAIRNLSLDRIKSMKTTDNKFRLPKDFDADCHFYNSVGGWVPNDALPKKVVLRTYGGQDNFLRTLPLHHSQQELPSSDGKYTDFEYTLCLTPDLTTEILSMGSNVEVLEPKELRDEVKKELRKAWGRY